MKKQGGAFLRNRCKLQTVHLSKVYLIHSYPTMPRYIKIISYAGTYF